MKRVNQYPRPRLRVSIFVFPFIERLPIISSHARQIFQHVPLMLPFVAIEETKVRSEWVVHPSIHQLLHVVTLICPWSSRLWKLGSHGFRFSTTSFDYNRIPTRVWKERHYTDVLWRFLCFCSTRNCEFTRVTAPSMTVRNEMDERARSE